MRNDKLLELDMLESVVQLNKNGLMNVGVLLMATVFHGCRAYALKHITMLPLFWVSVFLFSCFAQQYLVADDVTERDDLQTVLEDIRRHKEVHGSAPTMVDCFSYFGRLDKKTIEQGTLDTIFQEVMAQQSPDISLSDIVKIVQAKRGTLHDYLIQYEVTIDSRTKSGVPSGTMVCEFASKKNQYFLGVQKYGIEPSHDRFSYDGEKLFVHRSIGNFPDQGSVMSTNQLGIFFHPWMPLTLSGLFDTTIGGMPHVGYDLLAFLKGKTLDLPDGIKLDLAPDVFEKIEVIDGCRCIAVADFGITEYLDVDRDFSLVQSDFFIHTISDLPRGQMSVGRTLSARTKCYDLKDFGNGIWIPTKIETERFDELEKPKGFEKVVTKLIEINKGIDDSFFTDFIPDNTIMSDVENEMVYKWGDHSSIDSLLKETATSKRVWTFQIISVATGIIMIIIALIMVYLKRKNTK